jgi:hypothetical protein
MTMLNTATIAASDIKILAVLDADGETAVAEFNSNGAFFIADTSDLAEFGEVFQISNPKRMKAGATSEDKINAARNEYFSAAA